MNLILEAIKSLFRSQQNSIRVTQKAVADVDAKANSAKEAAYHAENVADNAQAAVSDKMDKNNPVGTGSFSMNRKADTVVGGYSSTFGMHNTASGAASHAEGYNTIAAGTRQHVQGQYNIADTDSKYLHIVGNGKSDSTRSNAHTLDRNGLGWFADGLKVGGTSQDDAEAKEVATKEDKLPNPHALTFSGAVSGTYDGSEPLTVEIPEGGSSDIVFEDSYVSDANSWVTNGYTKTGNQKTSNLPSEFDAESKWGVLFFIAENATNKTGTQMLYPIDGIYKGTIWTRSCVKQSFSAWTQLLTTDAISNGVKNPNAITFTGSSVGTYDGSKPLTINIPAGLSDDGSLAIPVATKTTLGGVKASAKTEDMTQPVGIGEDGFLFVGAAANHDDWVTVIDETISLSEGVYSITKSLGKTDPVKEFVLRVDLPVTETQVKFTAKINGVSLNHFNGLNSSTSNANYFQMFGNMFAPYFIYYSGNIDREVSSATTANYRPAGFVEQNGLGEFALVNAGNGTFMGDYRIRLRVRY